MMVRSVVLFCLAVVVAGCGQARQAVDNGDPLGTITRDQLGSLYAERSAAQQIPPEFIGMIRQLHEGVEFLVFLGLWCSDSEREVPRFLKIADDAGIPAERIRFISLDKKKRSPDAEERHYAIERVPTFVMIKGGSEIGRIVEIPRSSLEGDLLMILANAQSEAEGAVD